ncbi:INCREASED PETAL GROWTH ANISOTROPY 1-like protein 2 [Aristolochia californica]|uniref:INCREASED PETAL GROWTH ANISOTROPY 1-like protein 2 n=1 Tax=Aristolochia californica TaxID=171875 RepID=UPI0035E3A1E3
MKQEVSAESKAPLTYCPPLARVRHSRTKESAKPESSTAVSPVLKAKTRPVVPEANSVHKPRRSPSLNRLKPGEDVGAQKGRETDETRLTGRPSYKTVEQHARIRRRADPACKSSDADTDIKRNELLLRLEESEILVNSLQSEVSGLKAQFEKLQSLNVELESQNRQFREDLATAEAKISTLSSHHKRDSNEEKSESPGFRAVQKLIANKLEQFRVKKEPSDGIEAVQLHPMASEPPTKIAEVQSKGSRNVPIPVQPPPPPPMPQSKTAVGVPSPPPLPPRRGPVRTATMQKAPALVEFYHSLAKYDGKKDHQGTGNCSNHGVIHAHSSIVGEIQNRSSHLLAIKADIETRGDFIRSLIQKVKDAAYANIEDVLIFVEWLDRELASLSDERAVLKHFDWPEKKADAMREAAIEYRDLKRLQSEISSYQDDPSTSCEVELKKMGNLLDKSERSIQRLIKLRDLTMPLCEACKIPTDWMLDSGIISKIKSATVKLAKLYLKRVSMELESTRHSERESVQEEALLRQCIRFAYRAHQFAGGLDPETMCAFEEMRRRVPTHWGGSRELIPGMAS